jgi:hypothetical protein
MSKLNNLDLIEDRVITLEKLVGSFKEIEQTQVFILSFFFLLYFK